MAATVTPALRFRMPGTVLFGGGTVQRVGEMVWELGGTRPLVVTDEYVARVGAADIVNDRLLSDGFEPETWAGVVSNPGADEVERCCQLLGDGRHDVLVAVGGGSVIDVAKAAGAVQPTGRPVAECYGLNGMRRFGVPVVAVSTTAGSGAEVSSHAVIIDPAKGKKEAVGGLPVLPRAVIVDPELTLTFPAQEAVICAMDGLVHAVEAFVGRAATEFSDLFARRAIPPILRSLPAVVADESDVGARATLSLGCLYAGISMANSNAGVVHALGYPLTTEYGIPHGLANALVAPAALDLTWRGAPERHGRLARSFGHKASGSSAERAQALSGLVRAFLRQVGVAPGLRAAGVPEADLPRLAALASTYRPVLDNTRYRPDEAGLRDAYRSAWDG